METKKVFISYSQEDITYAKWLCGILELNGITAILPDHDNYDIEQAISMIDKSDAFVSLYSKNIKQIDNQSKETEHAFNCQKPFFFIMLNRCEIEGQYSYYLSRGERFEIYKNKSKALRLLVGRIKNSDSADYRKNKIQTRHIELLAEEDVDFILSGQKKKKTLAQQISPFSGLYSKHPTVNFALKCYSVILGVPFVFLSGTMLLWVYGAVTGVLFGETFVDMGKFLVLCLVNLMVLLLWKASYFPSIYIAKLGIKSKILTAVLVVLSIFLAVDIINLIGSI